MAQLKTDTWYPKYPADYLKNTLALTLEEDGFYNRALDQIYVCRGRIPGDPVRLQLILRLSPDQWERCKWIMDKYFYLDKGEYGNQRADQEIAKAQDNAKTAQENGKKGGRPTKNNPAGTQNETQQEPRNNPEETQRLTQTEPRGEAKPNPEKSSSSSPSSSSSELPPPVREARAGQPDYDRARKVASLYPAKASKDNRPINFPLSAQNLLAARIAANPDYPWEEHAQLAGTSPTPQDGQKWVEDMPNPVALEKLRKAAAPMQRKEYFRA